MRGKQGQRPHYLYLLYFILIWFDCEFVNVVTSSIYIQILTKETTTPLPRKRRKAAPPKRGRTGKQHTSHRRQRLTKGEKGKAAPPRGGAKKTTPPSTRREGELQHTQRMEKSLQHHPHGRGREQHHAKRRRKERENSTDSKEGREGQSPLYFYSPCYTLMRLN